MKRILPFLFLLISVTSFSQGFFSAKNIKVDLSGFVRNDFSFDTRRNVDACDRLLEFMPKAPLYDTNGEDINAQPSAQFLNTFTRFGTSLSGLEMGNAVVNAYVEVDFTGGASTNSLRFRHAFTRFIWPKSQLLFGRTWHPTFIEKVYPSTLNENTGLPFQVFNRSPQLRLTHHLSDNLDFIAGAVYQFKYANTGPMGKTYQYQRDAVVPNLHAQLQYDNGRWVLGAALDWKCIQPRTHTTGTSGTFVANEKLNTVAALAYFKYASQKFQVKGKSMYGQNVCESLLPSGYAVTSIDYSTGAETYTPFNHIYNWINFTYGNDWKFGLFAGYLKNLGTSDNPVGKSEAYLVDQAIYGFATNVDMVYKLSPQLIYTYKNFMFGWELSWTTAAWGENDYDDYARVIDTEKVTNFRNLLSVAYNF